MRKSVETKFGRLYKMVCDSVIGYKILLHMKLFYLLQV